MDSVKIILPFPPSLNAAYANIPGRGRVKTKRYKEWLAICPELDDRILGPVVITYIIYVPDKRIRDGNNLLKVVLDYLVSQSVVEADDMTTVKGEQWYYGGLDKDHPRIDITIRKMKNETNS